MKSFFSQILTLFLSKCKRKACNACLLLPLIFWESTAYNYRVVFKYQLKIPFVNNIIINKYCLQFKFFHFFFVFLLLSFLRRCVCCVGKVNRHKAIIMKIIQKRLRSLVGVKYGDVNDDLKGWKGISLMKHNKCCFECV